MSKHTWLCRPTKYRAELLRKGYEYAISTGNNHPIACIFAGYYVERCRQACNNLEYLYSICSKKWSIIRSRNVEYYARETKRHAKFYMSEILPMVWDWIQNDDMDKIKQLNVSEKIIPHTYVETYQEFYDAVLGGIN